MIVYQGESQLDGSPIIAVATIRSRNEKTGDMVQTFILRSDISPVEALHQKKDGAICGNCPQRHSLGGGCYVIVENAPQSVWRAYKAGSYSDPKHIAKVERALLVKPIRLGAYGDPAAVPFEVWEQLIGQGCGRFTGYTHQWKQRRFQNFKKLVMASCDNELEARQAKKMGWRFFLVTEGAPDFEGAIECLADARGMTCEECAICDGTRADSRIGGVSVAIQKHGALAKRFQLAVVR